MIVSIQYLRGIAAMLVVVHHIFAHWASLSGGQVPEWTLLGACGVDIFFVISGFIMWLTTVDTGITPVRFYAKRLFRIVPLYWVLTAVLVAVMLVAPRALNNSKFVLDHVLASVSFVPWPHPVETDKLYPVLLPGWTLNYEMFFYALFGAFLLVRPRLRLIGMVGTLAALVAVGRLVPPADPRVAFYTSPILLEFAIGMMLGALYRAKPRIDPAMAYAALCVGVGAMLAVADVHHLHRLVTFGLPAALIVFGAIYLRAGRTDRVSRPLLLLGEASYAIYLSQVLSLAGVRVAWHAVGLPAAGAWQWVFVLGGTALVALFGIGVHLWVEKPLAALLRPRGRPPVQIAATR